MFRRKGHSGSEKHRRRLPLGPIGWSLNALGVAATITLAFWPDARTWFLAHAGAGWLVATVLALTTATLAQVMYHQGQQHASLLSQVRDEHAREQAALQAKVPTDRDARLLAEWLGGWTQGGEFMDFLAHHFLGFTMPLDTALDLANRGRRWHEDKRQLSDPDLVERFAAVSRAVKAFWDATGEMFIEGTGEGRVLEIPNEWKYRDRDRYDAALTALDDAGVGLHRSLSRLFAAMHERGLPT